MSTKIALRKSETFHQGTRRATPFYSVYCKNGVNNRIKAFEKVGLNFVNHYHKDTDIRYMYIWHIMIRVTVRISRESELFML